MAEAHVMVAIRMLNASESRNLAARGFALVIYWSVSEEPNFILAEMSEKAMMIHYLP